VKATFVLWPKFLHAQGGSSVPPWTHRSESTSVPPSWCLWCLVRASAGRRKTGCGTKMSQLQLVWNTPAVEHFSWILGGNICSAH